MNFIGKFVKMTIQGLIIAFFNSKDINKKYLTKYNVTNIKKEILEPVQAELKNYTMMAFRRDSLHMKKEGRL